MAKVYSLVCFGGRTGKTVTISNATPAVVTLTSHGLRDGTGVVFSTTGSLPTGVTAGTTYYARSTASNTCNLYDTAEHAIAGGSTGRINTSSAGSGTHTIKSSYFLGLSADALLRYGSPGSERVYDGLVAWNSGRSGASALDEEICEIGEAFTELVSVNLNLTVPSAVREVTTKVNGVRSAAYHGGVVGAGYIFDCTYGSYGQLGLTKHFTTVDGFTTKTTSVNANPGLNINAVNCSALGMIVHKAATATAGAGINMTAASGSVVKNCLIIGQYNGIDINDYVFAETLANNTVVKSVNYGITRTSAGTFSIQGYMYNNISVGNGTNWQGATAPTLLGGSNNAGATGNAVWGTSPVTIATTDFLDYTNNDFRPALSSSPQVEAGVLYYGALPYDVADAVRPNYMDGAAAAYDVGAYEFDHGYGDWPLSTTVTFAGVNAGSEIRVYLPDGTETAGVESCDADHELTWTVYAVGNTDNVVTIRIVHTAYKIKEFTYTSAEGAQTLPVQQEADKWYRNP